MGKQIESAGPGGGDRINWEDHLGKLLVVEPLEVEHNVGTTHGESDAIRANVAVLLGKGEVEEYEDILVFPRVLQSQLRRKIGAYVVGRLTQGDKKPGKNAPWVMAEASGKELAAAGKYIASKPAQSSGGDDDFEDDDDSF